ncbi:MAG: ribosome recycling factor [Patescibacteria group bacterium]|nr:ribosome recycling factor [Patescibacteria group bacterium]
MNQYIDQAKQEFEKALLHLKEEYGKLQAGRANPSMVEGLNVDAYGSSQPVKAVATVTIPDPKTLQIQPWDKSMIAAIEKAIRESGLGLNPVNNGISVMLNIPPLTEERRTDLVKVVKKLSEEAKISIRNARQTAHTRFKEAEGAGEMTEDDKYGSEKKLQEVVDDYNGKVDEMERAKSESIMTV